MQIENCLVYTSWSKLKIELWPGPETKDTLLSLGVANKGSPLFILQPDRSGPDALGQAVRALEDPDNGEDGEGECGPVNEFRGGLLRKDGEKGPGDGDGCGEITFRGGECIGCGCAFEEEAVLNLKLVGRD
jgi:hypothetical protein